MIRVWPFKGDAPVTRAKKMCLAYRAAAQEQQKVIDQYRDLLSRIDGLRVVGFSNKPLNAQLRTAVMNPPPDRVADLDRRFTDWGESWHAEVVLQYGPDDWVPTKVAANLIQIAHGTLGRLRIRGRIKGEYRGRMQGYWYKVSDVYNLSSQLRGRGYANVVPNPDPTDTVPDSRSSAAK